jgi:hypothetical protein
MNAIKQAKGTCILLAAVLNFRCVNHLIVCVFVYIVWSRLYCCVDVYSCYIAIYCIALYVLFLFVGFSKDGVRPCGEAGKVRIVVLE